MPQFKSINSLALGFFIVQLSHPYMTTGKTIALTRWTFVSKVISLLFNMLSRLVIAFLPRRQASFNFMDAVTIYGDFGAQENSLSLSPLFLHLFAMKWRNWWWRWWSSFSECWVLSQLSHCPLSPSSRGSFVPLWFLPLGCCLLHIWGYWYFSQQSWFQLVLHAAWYFRWCILYIS